MDEEVDKKKQKFFWAVELAPLDEAALPKPEKVRFNARKGIAFYGFTEEANQTKFVMQKKESRRLLTKEMPDELIVATFGLSQVEDVELSVVTEQIQKQLNTSAQIFRSMAYGMTSTFLVTWRDEYWNVITAKLTVNGKDVQPYGLGVGHYAKSYGWPEGVEPESLTKELSKFLGGEVYVRKKIDMNGVFKNTFLVDFKDVKMCVYSVANFLASSLEKRDNAKKCVIGTRKKSNNSGNKEKTKVVTGRKRRKSKRLALLN